MRSSAKLFLLFTFCTTITTHGIGNKGNKFIQDQMKKGIQLGGEEIVTADINGKHTHKYINPLNDYKMTGSKEDESHLWPVFSCDPDEYEAKKLDESMKFSHCLDDDTKGLCYCVHQFACFYAEQMKKDGYCVDLDVKPDAHLFIDAVDDDTLDKCDVCGLDVKALKKGKLKDVEKIITMAEVKPKCDDFQEFSTQVSDTSDDYLLCSSQAQTDDQWCMCYAEAWCVYDKYSTCDKPQSETDDVSESAKLITKMAKVMTSLMPDRKIDLRGREEKAPVCTRFLKCDRKLWRTITPEKKGLANDKDYHIDEKLITDIDPSMLTGKEFKDTFDGGQHDEKLSTFKMVKDSKLLSGKYSLRSKIRGRQGGN